METIFRSSHQCKICGNTLWERTYSELLEEDQMLPAWECTNCFHVRPRKNRKSGTHFTPSQRRVLRKIRRLFCGYNDVLTPSSFYTWEVEMTDYGAVYVSIKTTDHPYTCRGIFASISRSGKLTILSVYDLWNENDRKAKHYAKMLGGYVY